MASKVEFSPTGAGNLFANCDGFGISFNPQTSALGGTWRGESEEETALCVDGRYFILNGDFREEYTKLADDGLNACIAFFLSKPELHGSWSNDAEAAAAMLAKVAA